MSPPLTDRPRSSIFPVVYEYPASLGYRRGSPSKLTWAAVRSALSRRRRQREALILNKLDSAFAKAAGAYLGALCVKHDRNGEPQLSP